MTNLSFESGTYKEYQLNGGETIRVNVADPGILDRLKSCIGRIEKLQANVSSDAISEGAFNKLDREMRTMVDGVLNCPGACDKAFGATNCFAIAGGKPIIINFLKVLMEQLVKDMKDVVSTVGINESIKDNPLDALDNERTRKYIKLNKETMEREHKEDLKEKLNVAALSQYERKMLLDELLGVSK